MQQAADGLLALRYKRQPLPTAAWIAQLGRPRGNVCSQRLQPTLATGPRHRVRQLTFLGHTDQLLSTTPSCLAAREAAPEAVSGSGSRVQHVWVAHYPTLGAINPELANQSDPRQCGGQACRSSELPTSLANQHVQELAIAKCE